LPGSILPILTIYLLNESSWKDTNYVVFGQEDNPLFCHENNT